MLTARISSPLNGGARAWGENGRKMFAPGGTAQMHPLPAFAFGYPPSPLATACQAAWQAALLCVSAFRLYPAGLPDLQRAQHGFNPGHFMRSEQVGLPQGGQHGKERFGTSHFFPEILEGMRQGVANRPA